MCEERELERRLETLRLEMAETKGRLANAPTTFQLLTWFMGIAVALVSLTFAIARAI